MKRLLQRLGKWEYRWLCLLVIAVLAMHFSIIQLPDKPVFDEIHYVTDGRVVISDQETLRGEHPPLGKLFVIAGDYIFSGFKTPEADSGAITSASLGSNSDDDTVLNVSNASLFTTGQTIIIDKELMEITATNTDLNQITITRGLGGTTVTDHSSQTQINVFKDGPLSWRFFSVILSAISIILFYLICRQLSMSRRASFLATFLLAFENMTFMFSGMAMLDVSCLTFTLAAFWLYLRGDYPLSGVMVALSALCKLDGALAIIAITLHWLFVRRDKIWEFFGLMIFAPVFFVGLMPLADFYPFHKFVNPLDRIITMLKGSASLTFANVNNTYAQRPWEWIFRYDLTPYTFNPNYLAVVSYTVLFLVIPVIVYFIIKAVKHDDARFFGLFWFAATYLVWIPAVILTNRVTYPYYFYPTIGAICIGLGMGLSQLIRVFQVKKNGKLKWTAISVVVVYLLGHLAFFILMSPLTYWWGTPIYK